MSTTFRKGELVIMQHATYFEQFNGCLGVVKSDLARLMATNYVIGKTIFMTGYCVQILHPNANFEVRARPYQIRRLNEGPEEFSTKKEGKKPKPVEEVVDE